MIPRRRHVDHLRLLLQEFPVVGILGPRQVGKTTLARQVAVHEGGPVHFFDLEDPRDVARLADPVLALEPLEGLVILDEVQRVPDLFRVLRVLADRPSAPARFLLSGSASPPFLRQTSESLAGRVAYHELTGLALDEVAGDGDRLWLRGGFPRAFLATTDAAAFRWLGALVRTHVERDLPELGLRLAPETIRRFWTMLAHYHAQIWNGAELARAFSVSESTVRNYLDVLVGTLMVRRLSPWHANMGKREVRSPKVYLADTGLLHRLLAVFDREDLLSHPKVGASWEGFALDQVVARLGAEHEECFFWAVHTGAELDLLVVRGGLRLGFEFKRTSAPHLTPSMRSALTVLGLERLDVVHAGPDTFPLAPKVRAVAMARLLQDLDPL
ncbi:ATP-binding protein [Myxococcota bacterium]|nr:ATP-binding protein [Myxococcota bacterium]